jgi:hypothetical protein
MKSERTSPVSAHIHNCEDSVMVLEGGAITECHGIQHRIGAGDPLVPTGAPRRFVHGSDSKAMRIFRT